MALYERDYQQASYGGDQFGSGPGRGVFYGMPRPTGMVKILLIINVVAYVLQLLLPGRLEEFFAVRGNTPLLAAQLWRLITFQFLHSPNNAMHLLFNMLGLYFLGIALERTWGPVRFLKFYLICGAVGGAIYTLTNLLGIIPGSHLIGASGGVLGLMVACAIMFPQFKVILILFPVPIRFAATLITVLYVLNVLARGHNAGGDVCHLGGMATAFIWVMGRFWFANQLSAVAGNIARQRQIKQSQEKNRSNYEVDRILAKVHDQGIQSLTPAERRTLQRASEQRKHGA